MTFRHLQPFGSPDQTFQRIRLNMIGPVIPSRGFKYCLTIFSLAQSQFFPKPANQNSRSRYPQPTRDGNSNWPYLRHWISYLDPKEVARDCIIYPLVNRAITLHFLVYDQMIRGSNYWFRVLLTVVLGLRNSLKRVLNTSPAKLFYGVTLPLLGE